MKTKKAKESVLVIERTLLEEIGLFEGLYLSPRRYVAKIFNGESACFLPRSVVETDTTFKQIIPYVLLQCGSEFFTYVRGDGSGEERLSNKRSIGIGGHINPKDSICRHSLDFGTYLRAVQREVCEEVCIESLVLSDKVVAIINDDSDMVGKVHLGIVHIWKLGFKNVRSNEEEISEAGFMSIEEILNSSEYFEQWSRILLSYIYELVDDIS